MKIPFSWLKEYVEIDITPEQLEEKLFSCGFEVEELIYLGKDITGVVVGEVKECEPIPETHLHLCKVDAGTGELLQICCGADNVCAGKKFPVALDGATVYATAKDHKTVEGVAKIKKGKLRGYESCGMLCSGTELGVNDDLFPGGDDNGLLVLPDDAVIGADIRPLVGLDDYIFDISITANRPDCQSVLGIAREVAALLNKPLKMPATDYTCTAQGDDSISVKVEAPDVCPRYLAHYVRNIRPAQSPRWLKRHLALCGLRSITNIVDITNHTLLEIGQPMHAFDLDKVKDRSIIVRRAKNGEKITTLDEKEFTLGENNLVICDAEKPVCIAGVMGGLNSGIADDSTELLFECATFARDSVRKTSRALGQVSDSSARYEKGVDQYSTELGLKRALHLIQQLDCGDITPTCFDCDAHPESHVRKVVTVTPEQIDAVLGIQVPRDVMKDILKRLDFTVEDNGGVWSVSVPRYRDDVEGFPDLAEEVIREYGYDHIVPTFLKNACVTNGGLNHEQKTEMKMKRLLAGQGFYEASTLAFYSVAELDRMHFAADAPERRAIRIMNPISENLSIMRTVLAPSMLNVIVDNLKKGNAQGRLFELSKVYLPKSLPLTEQPDEHMTLALGAFGPEEDFFTVKGAVEAIAAAFDITFSYQRANVCWLHPGISAEVWCQGKKVGVFGKLANEVTAELKIAKDEKDSQNIYLAELDYAALAEIFPKDYRYKPLSQYSAVKRDLALVCQESITCGDLEQTIRKASSLVSDVALFDVYRGKNLGEGKKSMAFSLTLSDPEKELPADQVDRAINKILKDLKFKLGVEMR